MMSRRDSKAPLLEEAKAVSPSPARDALKSNLDANTDADSTLTLTKKKSWFGSLRDVVQKGALQAKAAVDTWRTDQPKSDEPESKKSEDSMAESQPRTSSESASSKTGGANRRSSTPKSASVSLRRHLPHNSARHHRKRNSMFSVSSRPSCDISDIERPDTASSMQQSDVPETHKRKSSIANSLVGSIRGLGRRTGPVQKTSEIPVSSEPKAPIEQLRKAETVPLPSSPIDIPSAAPALELDLGPAGFMTAAFDSPETERVKEALRMTDPANITTGIPQSFYLQVPGELPMTPTGEVRTVSPRELLYLKFTQLDESTIAMPPGPPTPMPGTNLPLELDGASSDKSDRGEVFERTVTPPTVKQRKDLRTMRSLDAMAEACAVAHASDEVEMEPETRFQPASSKTESPKLDALPAPKLQPPRRDVLSTTTLHRCPSDMEKLSHQEANEPNAISTDELQRWALDNAVADGNGFGVGPPSPVRSVTLPFRPKTEVDGSSIATKSVDSGHTLGHTSDEVTGRDGTASPVSPIMAEPSLTAKLLSKDEDSEAHFIFRQHDQAAEPDFVDILASDPGGEVSVRLFHSSEDILPYEASNESIPSGGSPHFGPLVPRYQQTTRASPEGSPVKTGIRATYQAGLGDSDYQFHFDNWIQSTSSAYAMPDEPHAARYHGTDMCIDSSSTADEKQTPQISPEASSPERTPTMGDRVEFDLKRSERSSRYIALQNQVGQVDTRANVEDLLVEPRTEKPPYVREAQNTKGRLENMERMYSQLQTELRHGAAELPIIPHFTARGFDELDANALEAVDVEKACPDSPDVRATLETMINSDKLGMHSDIPRNSTETFDNLTTLEKNDMLAQPQQATGGLDSRNFSPTSSITSRDCNARPIRFAGLSVMEPLGQPGDRHVPESSASSIDFPLKRSARHTGLRVTSTDTLDDTLKLFAFPEGGHQADKSSVSSGTKSKALIPARYRSQRRKAGTSKDSV